jgi:hypothetical protein
MSANLIVEVDELVWLRVPLRSSVSHERWKSVLHELYESCITNITYTMNLTLYCSTCRSINLLPLDKCITSKYNPLQVPSTWLEYDFPLLVRHVHASYSFAQS